MSGNPKHLPPSGGGVTTSAPDGQQQHQFLSIPGQLFANPPTQHAGALQEVSPVHMLSLVLSATHIVYNMSVNSATEYPDG